MPEPDPWSLSSGTRPREQRFPGRRFEYPARDGRCRPRTGDDRGRSEVQISRMPSFPYRLEWPRAAGYRTIDWRVRGDRLFARPDLGIRMTPAGGVEFRGVLESRSGIGPEVSIRWRAEYPRERSFCEPARRGVWRPESPFGGTARRIEFRIRDLPAEATLRLEASRSEASGSRVASGRFRLPKSGETPDPVVLKLDGSGEAFVDQRDSRRWK